MGFLPKALQCYTPYNTKRLDARRFSRRFSIELVHAGGVNSFVFTEHSQNLEAFSTLTMTENTNKPDVLHGKKPSKVTNQHLERLVAEAVDLWKKMDATASQLVAFDHDEATREFYWKMTLDNMGKGDEYDAWKLAGKLEELNPTIKTVLRRNIRKYDAENRKLKLQISVLKAAVQAKREETTKKSDGGNGGGSGMATVS